jgi:Mg-chelatase subunit ChlD
MKPVSLILYKPRGKFASAVAGSHASTEVGGIGIFRDNAPFMRYPDARRIDIRATLRDPYEGTYVKRFDQRTSLSIYVIVDTSASMGFLGAVRKFDVAIDICNSMAYSSTSIGDRFGIIAGSSESNDTLVIPATRSISLANDAVVKLSKMTPQGEGLGGLISELSNISGRRKVIFIISDFRWRKDEISKIVNITAHNDVIPLVLQDSQELNLPRWGILSVKDSETNSKRTILMRPEIHARWLKQELAWRNQVICRTKGMSRAPIFIVDNFNNRTLSHCLMAA